MAAQPAEYDPDLTERLLVEGEQRLDESRKMLDELARRLDDAPS